MSVDRPFVVYVAETGNVFMQEIAGWLVGALGELGRDATLHTGGVPVPSVDHVNLVVAPHEYYELTLKTGRDRRRAALASIPVCTEQPGTAWFDLQLPYLLDSPLVLDISPVASDRLRALGHDAAHLPLGYQAGFDAWGGDADRERPIDVLFMGSLTPRREAALARMAALLSEFRCRFVLFEANRPARAGDPGFYAGAAKYELLSSAKILLNVHRNDVAYFESVRALEAVANGAVFLTEPAVDVTPFRAVEHIPSCPLDALAAACAALLVDVERQDTIRTAAYTHLRERHRLADALAPLLGRLEAAATSTVPRTHRALGAPGGLTVREADAGGAVSLPGLLTAAPSGGPTQSALFKRVILGQMQLRRRIDEIECLVRHGSTVHDELTATPAYDRVEPDVTVVIPCYNYGRHVTEAIDSVASCWGPLTDIVVVDDHSDDGSSEIVRRYMATHPWVPLLLVTRHANGGLAPARNLGFGLARASYVFPLDADNAVYPHAMARLHEALHGSSHAAAYGILEMFGEREGLLSAIDWDPRRLADGPYIDAAALIRKDAWEAVGGYSANVGALYGWEDYDLWLGLADHGLTAVAVPEILVRYRSHGESMIHTTNIDTSGIGGFLRRRHRNVPWPPLVGV